MRGVFVLLSGPSGSGKGTVLAGLKKRNPDFVFPLSLTTRKPRPKERHGEVYKFVSPDEFQKAISDGLFLEWAIVHGKHYYGTLKQPIMEAMNKGKIVVREVDVQGVDSIKKILPKDQLLTIFLTTPSWDDLKKRILGRAEMSDDELERRRQSYLKESKIADQLYDFRVFSEFGRIDKMITDVENLVRTFVNRPDRQP